MDIKDFLWERDGNGYYRVTDKLTGESVTAIPRRVFEGKPSPAGRHTFTTWRLWKKDEKLLPSGLIGPVTIEKYK